VKVAAATVREQIAAVLTGWGMLPDLVAITADVMVDTDLAGIDSHGISMLMYYEDMLGRASWTSRRVRPSSGTAR
jgi:LDH2 family malate/lactate/ureidoglycolate dehydrogenase